MREVGSPGIEPAEPNPSLQLSPSRGERALFGEAASELCGAASMLLGWRPEEFWNATPAELGIALQFAAPAADAPDSGTIERLRERFPDE